MIRCPTCNFFQIPDDAAPRATSEVRYNESVAFYFARFFSEVENLTRESDGTLLPEAQAVFMDAIWRMLNSIEGYLRAQRET